MNERDKATVVDNPKASPITRAYFDAQKPLGGLPTTERERALFESLQDALQKLYDEDMHKDCKRREEDLQDELDKVDEHVGYDIDKEDVPEACANLVTAKRLVEDRRNAEPIGTVTDEMYDRFRAERDATDLLEQLIDEVESWRELVPARST